MSTEDDLVKVLRALEKHIGGASSTTTDARGKIAGDKSNDADAAAQRKSIRATSKALDSLSSSVDQLDKKFRHLGQTLETTIGQFGALNKGMSGRAAKTKAVEIDTVVKGEVGAGKGALQNLDLFNRSLSGAVSGLIKLAKAANDCDPCPPCGEVSGAKIAGQIYLQQVAMGAAQSIANMTKATDDATKAAEAAAQNQTNAINTVTDAAKKLAGIIGGSLYKVIDDYYNLLRRGISGSENLVNMYVNAGKAGLSLQAYTQLLEENQATVARFGSFEEYDKQITKTTKQLNGLGIFGEKAAGLAGAMGTNAVTMGIPMSHMANATRTQVNMFEVLRKSTLMTADEFRDLANTVGNNIAVQEELLGVTPQEREARMANILSTASLGQQMGLTKDASRQLTESLLMQRKATAKDRFKAAGIMRQAGAMTGMSADDTERLARLSQKKNKSDDENKELVALQGQLQERIATMQNSGSVGIENIADAVTEQIQSSSQRDVAAASAQAQLQKQSGGVVNSELGALPTVMEKTFGQVMTAMSGIAQNPLFDGAKMIAQLLVQTALAVKSVGLLSVIAAASTAKGGKVGGMLEGVKTIFGRGSRGTAPGPGAPLGGTVNAQPGGGGPGRGRRRRRGRGGGGGAVAGIGAGIVTEMTGMDVGGLAGAPDAGGDLVSVATKSGGIANIAKTIGGAVWGNIGSILKGGAILAAVWGAAEEMFTGNLAAAGLATASEDFNVGDKGWIPKMAGMLWEKGSAMIYGAIRGIGTAVTGAIDGILNGFGVDLVDEWGFSATNMFDRIFINMAIAWKDWKLLIMKGWSGIASLFGISFLEDNIKDTEKEIATSKESLAILEKDGAATLTTIGESTQKEIAKQKAGSKRTSAEVSKSIPQLLQQASKTAATASSAAFAAEEANKDKDGAPIKATAANQTAVENAKKTAQVDVSTSQTPAQVAEPTQQRRPSVTSPEVNSTAAALTTSSGKGAETEGTAALGMKEVIDLLQKQLDVAQKQLVALTDMEAPSTGALTAIGRAVFPSTTTLVDRMYKSNPRSS